MKNYNCILFDFDGTLFDTSKGIVSSVRYALSKYGIEEQNLNVLHDFIGPPLEESFEKHYGFSKEDQKKSLNYYREHYAVEGILLTEPYDGIEQMLKELKKQGKKLFVATSKPETCAKSILKRFNMENYFDYVSGAWDRERYLKKDVISYLLKNHISPDDSIVMVGDRKFDVLGAKELNIDSVGVLYGFGSKEELTNAGANWLVNTPEELVELFKQG